MANTSMNLEPWQPGIVYANKEVEFIPTDTKESLEELCKTEEFREYFKQHGWLDPNGITYKINSHGYRCDEFEGDTDCIVALGCSFTMGTGLPVHSTWPQMVAKALGLKCYTLAWGGNSADTCFRLAEYWLPKLKPRAVFMLTPPANRFELIKAIGNPPIETFMPASESNIASEVDNYLKHWYSHDDNGRINHLKNKLAIKAMCNDLGILCQIYDANDHMSFSREEIGYARDRMHAGVEGHQRLSGIMLNDFAKATT